MRACKVWANRGASGYAPENTLEAIRLAMNMGVDGVKLDVRLTKDVKPVLIQDESIERVSNGHGVVRQMTLAELKEFQYNREHSGFSECAIPTLKEALQILSKSDIAVNLEIKNEDDYSGLLEEKVIELLERYQMENRTWISSLDHYALKRCKTMNAKIKTSMLYKDGIYEPASYAKTIGADAIQPGIHHMKVPGVMTNALLEGKEVQVWTANSVRDISLCIRKKADVIISNYPDKAILLATKTGGHYLFDHPFEKDESTEFYLFGAGYIGQTFLKRYQGIYQPKKIIDNDRAKWGHELMGIEIISPDELQEGSKVIVASAYYLEMIEQLQCKGLDNVYVYDTTMELA